MTGVVADVLWAAARPDPDPAAVGAGLAALDGAGLDLLATVAVRQRVAPLVWRAVQAVAGADLDGTSAAEQLAADSHRCRAQAAMVLSRVVTLALEPLQEAGHEPVVLKGAALVDRYPAPALRPMDDVDLFLPVSRHDDAVATLLRLGWEERPLGAAPHERKLVHRELPGLPLELHEAMSAGWRRSDHLDIGELYELRVPITVLGAPAHGLPVEAELVMLAAHAAKPFHVFRRLVRSVDVAVVLGAAAAAARPVRWDEVAALAHAGRCRTPLAVALAHARRLGASTPEGSDEPPVGRARRAALAPVLDPGWPLAEPSAAELDRVRYALIDDPVLRVGVLWGRTREGSGRSAPATMAGQLLRGTRRWWRLRAG